MKRPSSKPRYRLALARDQGLLLLPAALEIANDVKWMDEANNLAIDVALACKHLTFPLRAVLRDRRATRALIRNLRAIMSQAEAS